MNANRLAAVALAALLLGPGTATAAPADGANSQVTDASGPADAGEADDDAGETSDGDDADAAERAGAAGNERSSAGTSAADRRAADADDSPAATPTDERGPPTDPPSQVPDHVEGIHETIRQFLAGNLGNLGDDVADIVEGDDATESALGGSADDTPR